MNQTLVAIRESNRLLSDQNALLMRIAEQDLPQVEPPQRAGHMMNEHDLQLILMSDDIIGAIDQWNRLCDERKKRRLRP